MSKVSKKSLIASAVAGLMCFAGPSAADPLNDLHKAERRIHVDAAKSQNKIGNIFEQTQELLADYRAVVDEYENLKVYNDHVARLVADQQASIDSFNRQINEIETTKQGVVPLMYKMLDTLEQFVDLDVPIAVEERKARVERVREVMTQSNVSTSEQFRQVLEAYEIENDYGSMFRAYKGEMEFQGQKITVDFVHMGRVIFMAQTLDLKNAWVWNNNERVWEQLGDEYLDSVTKAIRMARKQTAYDLIKVPVFAAGGA